MTQQFFITGTNTEIGKTWMTATLLTGLKEAGYSTLGLKPIASGCESTKDGLRNEDALCLQTHSTVSLPYQLINPFSFEAPAAPHLLAQKENVDLSVEQLLQRCNTALSESVDYLLVEGVGGWQVPLNNHEMLGDFAMALGFPVILVVGMTLGCLNHALLTVESIRQTQLPIAGWIANRVDKDMLFFDENLQTLKDRIHAPCLGVVPYQESFDPSAMAKNLNLTLLEEFSFSMTDQY